MTNIEKAKAWCAESPRHIFIEQCNDEQFSFMFKNMPHEHHIMSFDSIIMNSERGRVQ